MALTAAQLAVELGSSDPPNTAQLKTATRLLSVSKALVLNYAPNAPTAVRDESCIRVAGYLDAASGGAALRSLKAGDVNFEFRSPGSALRLSGAAALLSPWRRRAVGRCEAT